MSAEVVRDSAKKAKKYRDLTIRELNKKGRLLGQIANLEIGLLGMEFSALDSGKEPLSVEGWSRDDVAKKIANLRAEFVAADRNMDMCWGAMKRYEEETNRKRCKKGRFDEKDD